MRRKNLIATMLAASLLLIATFNVQVAGQDLRRSWTSVGSAGTVDETDTGNVIFTNGIVALKDTANRAVIRYNVVAVEGIFGVPHLSARFRDNGEQARVIIRLIDYDLTTGSSNTLLTLDSNSYSSSGLFQKQSVHGCGGNWFYDFSQKAYYVEVELIRTGTSGISALGILQLSWTLC